MSNNLATKTPPRLAELGFATLFVIGTDTFLAAPLLPQLRAAFTIGISQSGWLVSAYAAGCALCALVVGPLSDRFDRRHVLLWGLAAFTVFTGACGLATGFWSLLIFRLLAGVAAAIASPQIWAAIPQLVQGFQVIKVMSWATGGLALAQLAGIPLGAFLAAHSWRLAFATVAGAALIVLIMLQRSFPPVPARQDETPVKILSSYRQLLSIPAARTGLAAYFIFQTGNFAALSLFGSWFARDFGLTSTGIGWAMVVIGAGNATGAFFGHRVVKLLGQRRSLLSGIVLMAGCYAVLAIPSSLPVALSLLALQMAVGGTIFPLLMALLQAASPQARGTMSALANVAMYAGTTVGVSVSTALFAHGRWFTLPALLTAGLFVLALTGFSATYRKQ